MTGDVVTLRLTRGELRGLRDAVATARDECLCLKEISLGGPRSAAYAREADDYGALLAAIDAAGWGHGEDKKMTWHDSEHKEDIQEAPAD